ncbi:DUF1801 domain-containing protein [Candidatus Saccharibacteria bacterium]|nr:DUF1801 domain-containing protein [Candidatus Saccharibacteria bacterium]
MNIHEYLANLSQEQQRVYVRISKLVISLVPDVEEVMSYEVPTFKYKGKVLLHFGAFKNHMSIFPGGEVTEKFADRLTGFKVSKGTIQFTLEDPVPDDLMKDIIKFRLDQIASNT